MTNWTNRVRDWIKEQWPLLVVFAIMVVTVIFLAWVVFLPPPYWTPS